jgi:putative hydrolase of the HAD superfamily
VALFDMSLIKIILSDVGGVLLTDGWGHISRRKAAEQFALDWEEFESLHAPLAVQLDSGEITLAQYLESVVFYKKRSFSIDDFVTFIKAQSVPIPGSLPIFATLAKQRKWTMGTLNNESLEINQYRIDKFKLADTFSLFFSSCFMGCAKPDQPIYQRVLDVTQKPAQQFLFVDDREENLVQPRKLGFNTVHFQTAEQLQKELRLFDIGYEGKEIMPELV